MTGLILYSVFKEPVNFSQFRHWVKTLIDYTKQLNSENSDFQHYLRCYTQQNKAEISLYCYKKVLFNKIMSQRFDYSKKAREMP